MVVRKMGNTGNMLILGFSPEYPNPPALPLVGGVTVKTSLFVSSTLGWLQHHS